MEAALRQEHSPYSLTHLSNIHLIRNLESLLARECASTAVLLAHIAEVDTRQLYAPAGCSSMFVYCVEKLHLSEDAAYRRIRAARAARQFPILFDAVADGRLHLAAVSAIAPFLTGENVDELIEVATHRRKSEIEELLTRRFPSTTPEPRTVVRPLAARVSEPRACEADHDQLVLGRVESGPQPSVNDELVLGRVEEERIESEPERGELVLARVGTDTTDTTATTSPPSEERYLVQVAITKGTHDKLRKAQALLSHVLPNGDVAQVLDRALDTLIAQLETRKAGAKQTRPANAGSARVEAAAKRSRYIPAPVRRAVWERDGARCTFVGSGGHRCGETRYLEFDHVEPFARGGRATVDGLRLRCRAHNQHEAERTLGREFMKMKRGARSR